MQISPILYTKQNNSWQNNFSGHIKRPRSCTEEELLKMIKEGKTPKEIAKIKKVKPETVVKNLKYYDIDSDYQIRKEVHFPKIKNNIGKVFTLAKLQKMTGIPFDIISKWITQEYGRPAEDVIRDSFIKTMKQRAASGLSYDEIAKEFDMSSAWFHGLNLGLKSGRKSKCTEIELSSMLKNGKKPKDIALEKNIDLSTVYKSIRRFKVDDFYKIRKEQNFPIIKENIGKVSSIKQLEKLTGVPDVMISKWIVQEFNRPAKEVIKGAFVETVKNYLQAGMPISKIAEILKISNNTIYNLKYRLKK